MSPEVAATFCYGTLAAGTLTWLLALRAHRRAFRPADLREPDLLARFEIEIDAPPSRVSERASEALRTGGLPGLGGALLTEVRPDRIAGELSMIARRGPGRKLGFEIHLRDSTAGPGAAAEVVLRRKGGEGLRIASAILVYLAAPLLLATAFFVMRAFVLPSDDPNLRAQAVQTIQIVHVLWPPFLLAHFHRRLVRVLRESLATVLRNAAF